MNLSTPRIKARLAFDRSPSIKLKVLSLSKGLAEGFEVHPEARFLFTSRGGFRAAERVYDLLLRAYNGER